MRHAVTLKVWQLRTRWFGAGHRLNARNAAMVVR